MGTSTKAPEEFSPRNALTLAEDGKNFVKKVSRAEDVTPDTEAVKAAVRAYKSARGDEILSKTPLDVLNQGARHFRLDGLKDRGYLTVLAVRDVPAYKIDHVPGMGRGVAYELKNSARQYSDLVERNLSVRLNLDDDSPEMAKIITALARYRRVMEASKRFGELSAISSRVSKLSEKLGRTRKGIWWLLLKRSVKDSFRKAYGELRTTLLSNDASELLRRAGDAIEASHTGNETARRDFEADPVGFASELERIVPGLAKDDNGAYGLTDELAKRVAAVEFSAQGLKASLRRYQEWGVRYVLAQKRVLLGDEMGLGKTVQALGVIVALRNRGLSRFMVVCPLSVLENWCREISDKSDMRPLRIYGPERMNQFGEWSQGPRDTIAVTTYETLAHFAGKVEKIDCLVVDEAHYAKNPDAKRSQNVRKLTDKSDYVLFMTGTALENRTEEMVSLISMLQPDTARKARLEMASPFGDGYRNAVASVYYRRRREDVLQELPDLIETEEWCDMGKEETAAYVAALRQGFMAARRLSWNVGDLSRSSKARRLKEIAGQARDENRKVLVFSYFRKTLQEVSELLGSRCIGPINGSVGVSERQRMVDEFDRAPAGTTLVAQIQAGGTGLNIQAASVVVICEPQYKPSIENQAISRAYRMGQTRSVFVHRLLCTDTIDQRITRILRNKQAIFDNYADKSAAAASIDAAINQETMSEMVKEELAKYGSAA